MKGFNSIFNILLVLIVLVSPLAESNISVEVTETNVEYSLECEPEINEEFTQYRIVIPTNLIAHFEYFYKVEPNKIIAFEVVTPPPDLV